MCPHISHNPGGRAREAREANPRCWQPVHPSRWAPASFDLRCDASVRQPERAPASFTLRCRPPAPLVVGSECSTTPPSQLWKVSEWSEVSEVSEWKKWSVFGPLFFLELIYIIDHIYTFIATRGNCAQQLSYGCKILDKLGVAEKNFKIWLLGWFFQKWSPTCRS